MIAEPYRESLAQRFDFYEASVLPKIKTKKWEKCEFDSCHMLEVLPTPQVGIKAIN